MFTKKAQKLLRKLPAPVRAAAVAADESEAMGAMLQCSNKSLVSIKLPGAYRMIKTRKGEVQWVGSHEDYNKLLNRKGKV